MTKLALGVAHGPSGTTIVGMVPSENEQWLVVSSSFHKSGDSSILIDIPSPANKDVLLFVYYKSEKVFRMFTNDIHIKSYSLEQEREASYDAMCYASNSNSIIDFKTVE